MLSWRKKSGRVHAQIRDMCAILCGLVVAQVGGRAGGQGRHGVPILGAWTQALVKPVLLSDRWCLAADGAADGAPPCAVAVVQDYRRGQQLITDRNFADLSTFFQVARGGRTPWWGWLIATGAARSLRAYCFLLVAHGCCSRLAGAAGQGIYDGAVSSVACPAAGLFRGGPAPQDHEPRKGALKSLPGAAW